ncbi:hypothetical protein ILUMI_23038 [Ignelater luminosus]|uniref:Uncharacterized protein n=1 Tax=Ignelater luminosus TaxID=2038154 RepID=A0A8K0CD91_IGNLU|nr:hypothetical protein ILUMI_23038 [Ignelater luminosus]
MVNVMRMRTCTFRRTETVDKDKSSRRTTVLTEDVLEDVRTRMKQNPKKSLRQLLQQTGTFKLKLWNIPESIEKGIAFVPIQDFSNAGIASSRL